MNIQNSKFNIQNSTFKIHHSKFKIQHSTFKIQHSKFSILPFAEGAGAWVAGLSGPWLKECGTAGRFVLMMKRRHFLHSSATLGLGAAATRLGLSATTDVGSGMRVGVIGCGWYGKNDAYRLMQVAPVTVTALCDPDARMLDEAAGLIAARQPDSRRPATFADFREMLSAEPLDLVIIGTPDHWHALPTIAAIEAGAHVYLQKPVAVDVLEGEAILAAARRHNRIVQVGTQRRSTPHLIEAREKVIDAGLLGTIGHAEIFSYYHMRRRGRPPIIAPPDHLDWDLWCGPAPLVEYHEGIHPGGWRSYREFGNGMVGDMCIHMLDTVRWMLGLGWPRLISSSGGIFIDPEARANVPDTQTAMFRFENMSVTWQHRTWGHAADVSDPWGLVIYGDKGTLRANVRRYEFTPHGSNEPTHRGEALIERGMFPHEENEPRMEWHAAPPTRRHFQDMLAAIANGGKPVADIAEGHISSACCVLANLSLETGRSIAYDPSTQSIPGDAEATSLLRRPYRGPWIHPAAR